MLIDNDLLEVMFAEQNVMDMVSFLNAVMHARETVDCRLTELRDSDSCGSNYM